MSPPRVVCLQALNDAEYAEFTASQIVEYADQLTRAGEVARESSLMIARALLDDLVSDRLREQGHEFFAGTSIEGAIRVGWIWISPAPSFLGAGHAATRWLSQLTVDAGLRGRGFGRALLVELERHLAARGVEQLWLRVFDWNVAARRLYASLGFEVVSQFPVDAHLRKYLIGHRRGPHHTGTTARGT